MLSDEHPSDKLSRIGSVHGLTCLIKLLTVSESDGTRAGVLPFIFFYFLKTKIAKIYVVHHNYSQTFYKRAKSIHTDLKPGVQPPQLKVVAS